MKILHIVSSYWPAFEFGGPIQTVHLLNKFLVKQGIEVTVYTTNAGLKKNKNIPLKKSVDLDGVKVFYFPYLGYRHYNFSPSLFFALKRNLRNFDLIHITGVWNFPVCAAAFWARFYKKPYIISPRGSLMKEPLEKKSRLKKRIHLSLIGKRDLKNAAAIHFTTEAEKEEYLKAGLPLKKAIVIPNGLDIQFGDIGSPKVKGNVKDFRCPNIDNSSGTDVQKLDFRKKFNITPDKKIVLFLSRLSWKKGLDTLIPAFAEVVKKEPKAVLILAGPDDEGYKKEVEKLILRSSQDLRSCDDLNIIFTGMLTGADKVSAFQESDVFVLPSYSENFGQVVVEAMYFGLPVVITKNVGIAPSVEKAQAGLIIDKDEKQLAEAILRILNNQDLAKKMGEQGKCLVETEFSWPEIAERFVKEYNEIINSK